MKTRTLGVLAAALMLTVACSQPDAVITGNVKTGLAADPDTSALKIDVDTQAGVVTLTGNLDDQVAKDRAIAIAGDTQGVKRVVDMLSVRQANGTGDAPSADRTPGQKIDDASITMAVKAKLLADPEVQGLDIDVDTRDGVVYLTGSVKSADQRAHAIELASGTDNVREVEDNLIVKAG